MIKQIADAFGVDPEGLELVTKESEMNIKEIACGCGAAVDQTIYGRTDYVVMTEYDLQRYSEALLAEVQRQNEPAGFISKFASEKLHDKSSIMGVEISNTQDKRHPAAIFTFPPDIESEREKVAEACAVLAKSWGDARLDDNGGNACRNLGEAIRAGEWKRYVKEGE